MPVIIINHCILVSGFWRLRASVTTSMLFLCRVRHRSSSEAVDPRLGSILYELGWNHVCWEHRRRFWQIQTPVDDLMRAEGVGWLCRRLANPEEADCSARKRRLFRTNSSGFHNLPPSTLVSMNILLQAGILIWAFLRNYQITHL